MAPELHQLYGNQVRVRASGLLISGDEILLVNHKMSQNQDFWAPPGGGIKFGETAITCLKREFLEETGLEIDVKTFLFAGEFIARPLHAVELFFEVGTTGGTLTTGSDPEMPADKQLIQSVKFISWDNIAGMSLDSLHGIFRNAGNPRDVMRLNGYHRF